MAKKKSVPVAKRKTSNDDKQVLAFQMYCKTNMTQKEIAVAVGVAEKTIGAWKNAEDWKIKKAAATTTKTNIVAQYYMMLAAINEAIEANGGIPTAKDADAISKITGAIQTIDKRLNLSNYVDILEEFTNYMKEIDLPATQQIVDFMTDFLNRKARTLRA